MSPGWGITFWNGKFAFGSGAFVIGVGRIRRHHFGVGNCRSGVGRLFVVWEIAIGVGILFLMWETPLGVGRLPMKWGVFRGLPAHFYRRIEPPTVSDLAHAPTARPFSRNLWSGAFVIADDSPGTD